MVMKGAWILDAMRKIKAGKSSDLIFNLIYYFGSCVGNEFLGYNSRNRRSVLSLLDGWPGLRWHL